MQGDENGPGEALAPVRGLLPIHNRRGKPFATRDVHRWLRLDRTVHKTEKIDLLVYGPLPSRLPALIEFGQSEGLNMPLRVSLSLRTDCAEAPRDLETLKRKGLFDVFLCPPRIDSPALDAWLAGCRQEDIPVRLALQPPFPAALDVGAFADRVADAGVKAINVVLSDPFQTSDPCSDVPESRRAVEQMNALAAAVDERGVEANLYGLPLCLVDEQNRIRAGNSQRFFLDHQQYHRDSYGLALALHRRHPKLVSLAVAALLARHTAFRSPADAFILKHLVMRNRRRLHEVLLVFSKLVRRFRLLPGTPKELEHREERYRADVTRAAEEDREGLPVPCRECSLRRVCDHVNPVFRKCLPGLDVTTQSGELVVSPLTSLRKQRKYYDAVDTLRRGMDETAHALAREAQQIMLDSQPSRPFRFDDVQPENAYAMRMPGAYRYMTFTDRDLLSTILFWDELPCTISVTFGGGIADYVGFTISDTIKLLCPMEAFSHQVVLHAATDGRYVLLRDGVPIRPVEFQGKYYVPRRLPSIIQVRLTMWNVDGALSTQNPQVWSGRPATSPEEKPPRYSVLIVSTRFSRRLQAVLQSVAHQEGIDPSDVEVIVGYVPGIDATDDVIASMGLTHPALRVLRSPFPEQKANAKGLIINKSFEMASGEWIIILDSDVVLPPTMFAEMAKLDNACMVAAPMGRKMLPPEVTAKVLLGEIRPWREWDALLAGPGEDRYGDKREGGLEVPVGFCQCVKAECLKTIKYQEYDHFEGADWEFAVAAVERYGPCAWLNIPVLHLDHGGCQWYGSRTQR